VGEGPDRRNGSSCDDLCAGGDFPADGIARFITPGDTPYAHGRWVSNLDLIDVTAVPEPATMALLASGLITMAVGAVLRRRSRSGYALQSAR
jgi:hypothetical protein